MLLELQELLGDRVSSLSWSVGAQLLADLQAGRRHWLATGCEVSVNGDFAAAEATLASAERSLPAASAARLEATRCNAYIALALALAFCRLQQCAAATLQLEWLAMEAIWGTPSRR